MQNKSHDFYAPVRLQTNHFSLSIGKRQLVTKLNWQVDAGECWCIIGRNGAGKTTLLRSLAGLLNIAAGSDEILLNSQPLNYWSLVDLARMRSYLPQGRNDAFGYRVIETVFCARYIYHDSHYWESSGDVAVAQEALAELGVADLAERDIRSLSGGERQRVAIAAVLAQDAQLMLLDEPTSALDLAHQIRAMHLLSQRCQQKGKAIVMASHDLNLAYHTASHALLLMNDGSWQAGPIAETMTADSLSQCLGHPIEAILHGEQRLFLPLKTV